MNKRIVIALGGNALQRQGEASAAAQKAVAAETAKQIVKLIYDGYQIVIVHGNGPQVGDIILHEEAINTPEVPTWPIDSCGAMSQGAIGYWLQQALINEFTARRMHSTAATLVTQMVVSEDDPAFQNPTKPIGPFYKTQAEAKRAAGNRQNFTVKEDAGRGWRRVVPSPKPKRILESYTLCKMVDSHVTVITAGGGGIPVVRQSNGKYTGIEAVIDKDFSAAVVADTVGADRLIILTAVDYVMTGYNTPNQRELHEVSRAEMERYADAGEFAAGSMLPKVMASLSFLKKPGRTAVIASLDHALDAAKLKTGTIIKS